MRALLAGLLGLALVGCSPETEIYFTHPRIVLQGTDGLHHVDLHVRGVSSGSLVALPALPDRSDLCPCEGPVLDIGIPSAAPDDLRLIVRGFDASGNLVALARGALPRAPGACVFELAPPGCSHDADGDGFCIDDPAPYADCDDGDPQAPLSSCPDMPPPADTIEADAQDSEEPEDATDTLPDTDTPWPDVDDPMELADNAGEETVQPPPLLCFPCGSADVCTDATLSCRSIGDALGSFCLPDCAGGALCPGGTVCGGEGFCVPAAGDCLCGELAANAEAKTPCSRGNEHGTCEGVRTCMNEGAAATGCTAAEPAAELCDGEDNDCDAAVDEKFPEKGDTCTQGGGSCAQVGVMICDEDGGGTHCSVTGTPATTPCDDGDPCSVGTACTGGPDSTCGGGAVYACTGACRDCDGTGACALGPGVCFIGSGGPCDPTDPGCKGTCYSAGMDPTGVVDGHEKGSASCSYCNPAQPGLWSDRPPAWECLSGGCELLVWQPPTICGPDGACTPPETAACDDGIDCTGDACDPAAGCSHAPQSAACEDDVSCTVDLCVVGQGCSNEPSDEACEDGECTADWCDPDKGCQHSWEKGTCPDDGLVCTVDVCTEGIGCPAQPAPLWCLIDGKCHGDEASDPENPCRYCDPSSPNAWSLRADGTECLAETTTSPSGVCIYGECVLPGAMASVPAGSAWMGCSSGDPDCAEPTAWNWHEVVLPKYEVDRTEVTAQQYYACHKACEACCPAPGWTTCGPEDDPAGSCNPMKQTFAIPALSQHPVNQVTRAMAEGYCQWAKKRLCSEAEWEKAARGGCDVHGDGTTSCEAASAVWTLPWGDEDGGAVKCGLAEYASYDGCSGAGLPDPVGSALPDPKELCTSSYGLCDLAGNVMEWVRDSYHPDYYGSGPSTNPQGPCFEAGTAVVRGGGMTSGVDQLRVYWRGHLLTDVEKGSHVGFRCCRGAAGAGCDWTPP